MVMTLRKMSLITDSWGGASHAVAVVPFMVWAAECFQEATGYNHSHHSGASASLFSLKGKFGHSPRPF